MEFSRWTRLDLSQAGASDVDHPLCCGWGTSWGAQSIKGRSPRVRASQIAAQDWWARCEGRRKKKWRRPRAGESLAPSGGGGVLGAWGGGSTEQEGTLQEEWGHERSWVGCTWRATARPLRVGQCHGHQRMPGRGVRRWPG